MPQTLQSLTLSWPDDGELSRFEAYQRLVAGAATFPSSTIAPLLDETDEPWWSQTLPGLPALAAASPTFPSATIAPDLD